MCDAFDWLAAESGPRVLPLHLTPYVMGLPFRVQSLEALLQRFAGTEGCGFVTAGQLASALNTSA